MVAGSDSCRRDQREDWENILSYLLGLIKSIPISLIILRIYEKIFENPVIEITHF